LKIAFIPARGNSQGIPLKNIQRLQNAPLVEWATTLANLSGEIDKLVLSTDDERIIEADANFRQHIDEFKRLNPGDSAEVSHRKVIHKRISEHASNSSKTIDCMMQFADTQQLSDNDVIVLLQPTAPFRSLKELKEIILKMELSGYQSVGSATIFDSPHPSKAFLISEESSEIDSTFLRNLATPRQELPTYFIFDGAYYLNSIGNLRMHSSIVNESTHIVSRAGFETINIDNINDLNYARYVSEKMNMFGKLNSM
jgi:CMP-N-acetylneuraminic acid synthetase